jgi:hypothetical protein
MRELITWRACDEAHGWRATDDTDQEGRPITALLGPEAPARAPFDAAVPSWAASTPPEDWIEVQLRARVGGRWTGFYRIAQWDSHAAGSRRQSFGSQRDADGRVATDTLKLGAPADAIQARVLLRGAARLDTLWLALSGPGEDADHPGVPIPVELEVPPRAQLDYPNGGEICSPTSVAMLLAYWYARTGDARLAALAERQAIAEVICPQVYDPVYEGHGNWGFNTAFAASLGLEAYVARMASLAEVAPWVAAGVPVIISVAWGDGELAGAPIPSSGGHLLVVTGFDADGRAFVADPRGDSEGEVRRIYDAAQLTAAWQSNSTGTAYLIYPRDWPVPSATMA